MQHYHSFKIDLCIDAIYVLIYYNFKSIQNISNQLNDQKKFFNSKIVICIHLINRGIRFINFGARLSSFFTLFKFLCVGNDATYSNSIL